MAGVSPRDRRAAGTAAATKLRFSCVISALSCLWSLKRRKLLRFLKNVLSFCPYGYSKEKCILPSCSRLGN